MAGNRGADGRFRPGFTGNRNGARRPRIVTALITAALQEETADGETTLQRIVATLIDRALGGDLAAIQAVIERVEGKLAVVSASASQSAGEAARLSDADLLMIAHALAAAGEGGDQ